MAETWFSVGCYHKSESHFPFCSIHLKSWINEFNLRFSVFGSVRFGSVWFGSLCQFVRLTSDWCRMVEISVSHSYQLSVRLNEIPTKLKCIWNFSHRRFSFRFFMCAACFFPLHSKWFVGLQKIWWSVFSPYYTILHNPT